MNMDMYGFYTGKILDAYNFLGCHLTKDGAVFRTFAPEAAEIFIIGEFNDWSEEPMHKIGVTDTTVTDISYPKKDCFHFHLPTPYPRYLVR